MVTLLYNSWLSGEVVFMSLASGELTFKPICATLTLKRCPIKSKESSYESSLIEKGLY